MTNRNRSMSRVIFSCLVLLVLPLPSMSLSVVMHNRDEFEIEGSAWENGLDECLTTFVGFENTFLRGVREEYFITYNQTTFEDCLRYCCMETHFVCNSFSYFEAIKVCYVMNQTMHEDSAHLAKVPGWKHYHRQYPTDETTVDPNKIDATEETLLSVNDTSSSPLSIDATTNSADVFSTSQMSSKAVKVNQETTNSSLTDDVITDVTIAAVANENSPTETVQSLSDAPSNNESTFPSQGLAQRLHNENVMSKDNCEEKCQNGGMCEFVATQDDVVSLYSIVAAMCKCQKGFTGKYCESVESEAEKAGPPAHVIAGAAVGIFIFLLFAIVIIVFVIYQHKTGKYKVKNRRLQWRRRAKKTQSRRSHSFIADDKKMPFRSDAQDADETSDIPSSTTSV